jgi:predicted alpha/beta superfamily hydrolase
MNTTICSINTYTTDLTTYRMFKYLLAGLLSLPISLSAQLTLRITAVPTNTPAGATLHAAGNFNNWNAGDQNAKLTLNAGVYTITLNPTPGQVEFKFTRGSWATVEGNANGTFRPNRTINYTGAAQTLDLTVLSWEDLGGGGTPTGTAAPNVSILDDDLFIPQLNRNRRVWLYLPPDYQSSTKRYPVLYMHDGQNLFNSATAGFGVEWQVDETLNTLHQQGDYGCIVVGIDHGGTARLDEYSPWVNAQYGGGLGDEYIDFIVNTLKPRIDSAYRTLPGRLTTGIMGSSMGGLISMYGFSERQDIFSKAGIFSPAFWFAGSNSATHVAAHPRQGAGKVYFLAGGAEPASVAQNMQTVATAMTTAGFSANEKLSLTVPGGQHTESFWAQEFSAAYRWLFQNAVSTATQEAASNKVQLFPNPANTYVRIGDYPAQAEARVQLYNAQGRLVRDTSLVANTPIYIGDLPNGAYTVRVRYNKERKWRHGRVAIVR